MVEPQSALAPYDALLLVSFGGPEGPDEVLPFLQQVTRGRNIPDARLREVGAHYDARGGVSPINEECRRLLAAMRDELSRRGIDIPVAWGNRNSPPWLEGAMAELAETGQHRVLALTTSAYQSYSSCRQYREDLARTVRPTLWVDKIRPYATHPGFVAANAERVLEVLPTVGPDPRLVYVTHSIPTAMAHTAGPAPRTSQGAYVEAHHQVAAAVTDLVDRATRRTHSHDVVYCSRSGSPRTPWLEPDVNDHLATLASGGIADVVAVPIGFTSDHMEVVHDLDTEAAATAAELGLGWARARTVRTHPSFVAALIDLALERAALARGERPEQPHLPGAEVPAVECPAQCCPNLQHPDTPALCGAVS